ncbi:type VI secretion system membrane subunit TssM [Hafnia alvei]|uniref:Type VI secretion system membrane subunit TssM n=1 Tax=Hafnia alvei TaxID=569 RepID=A0ABD7Q8N1_HAFAL|nr:type VI secretion system membrane subunit TssM [Hafnia alvei]TBL68527.1 type VI secretion system membrane subunit TssM [Hafnia alvei]
MSYLNRFFSARAMKTLLILCCIGLLVAAIWFLGSFFGFGNSRPLQSVESRVIVVLLLALCLVGYWLRWPLFIMVTAALCVLVWVFGPFLLLGEGRPLESVSVRLTIIEILIIGAFFYGFWLLLLALKDNPALLDKFTRNKKPSEEIDVSEASLVISRSVDYVNKKNTNLTFFQRVILARKSHDLLPWFMVLGTQGAGKTSAILGSGQEFPLSEQLNQIGKPAQKTRSCECWFANDAVYIDTAGKYVSEPETNLAEWGAMLKTLKKHRPIKALNGAIVTFSAADVLGRNQAELFELAATLRARIDDLRQTLGVRFPVYVLVTKLDQLTGFTEYFKILTEQERGQVWGVAFPYGDTKTASVSELHDQIKEELLLLENRIERDMIVRQQEEYDNRDRKEMYALPQDFHLLSERVAEVVHNIAFASRYDDPQNYTLLRGIYLSSSHQPLDFSILNNQSIIRTWSNYVEKKSPKAIASIAARSEDRDFLINDVSYGRQYFLKQLFKDVFVKDQDLARHNMANESKYRLQRFLGHTFCILLALLLLNGFYNSYRYNSDYLDAVDRNVTSLGSTVNSFISSPTDSILPRLLTLSRYLPVYRSLDVLNPQLEWRYGLYTGGKVFEESDSLYQFFLQRILLPQIEHQVTLALQNAIDNGKSEQIYHQLKVYLQVYGRAEFDKQYIITSITRLWDSASMLQPYEERQVFVTHLKNLLDSPEWRRYGQNMDEGLVKSARALLEREDQASRLYKLIKDSVMQDVPADLTLSTMAKSRRGELFSPIDDNGVTVIPGFFTHAGYYNVFKKKMELSLATLEREDSWVLGKTPKNLSDTSFSADNNVLVNPVQNQVLAYYLDEYALYWTDFLSNIRIKLQDSDDAGVAAHIYMLRTLSAQDSPLVNLVTRAVSETTLVGKEENSLLDNINNKGQVLNAMSKINLAHAAMERKLLQERVDNRFAPLREFVTGNATSGATQQSRSGADLDKLMGSLSEQYTLFVIYGDAIMNGNAVELSSSAQQLGTESQIWPEPFPNLIPPLLESAWKRLHAESVLRSNEGIEEALGKVCRKTLQGRYPFADSRRDVKITDFENFFASDGLVDEYFKTNLANKVDVSSHPWRYKDGAADSEVALDMFEKATEIRHQFFHGEGGRSLSLVFDISVPYLDPAITQLNMNFDGKQVNYAHWPVLPVSVMWPASRSTSKVTLNATPRIAANESAMMFTGPWALFRWMDNASDIETTDSGESRLIFDLDSRRAKIDISGLTYNDRPVLELLKNFRCVGDY